MSVNAEPTPSELMRRMDDLVGRLEALTNKVEESYVRHEVFKGVVERLSKMEDRFEWVVRLMLGMVIASIVAMVLTVSK